MPEKLPDPVNSDFDDCSPVCMPGKDGIVADRLFFSSSRPQALGGYDIFQVDGRLTGEAVELIQKEQAVQLPFEINSTADEYLYWENQEKGEAWLTTNRNQDFEGREVWRFDLNRRPIIPVAVSIQTDFGSVEGRLSIQKDGVERIGIEHSMSGMSSVDLLLAAGEAYQVTWEAKDGTMAATERIAIGQSDSPSFLSEPLHFQGISLPKSLQSQLDEQVSIEQPVIQWSFSGLSNQVFASMFGEKMNGDALAAIRAEGIHEVGIEKVLQATSNEEAKGQAIPNWMLEAMHEIGVATTLANLPEPVQQTREHAVDIQSRMEETQCWDAPGSEAWKAQVMIERFGEPALALLSEEVRQLRIQAKFEQDRWGTWSDAIAEYVYQTGVDSEDWTVLKAYCEAQFQAFSGAYVHAEDMFRRIDSHLRFERWITEALPMEVDAFREDLGAILTNNPTIINAFAAAATAAHENANNKAKFEDLQTALWGVFTDEIIGYHDLGIYTLQGMEKAQSWFLRSGGIIEELHNQSGAPDRLTKGQQAVGLAWETRREGARKKNQVLKESEMSPGAWWESFGPANTDNLQTQDEYAGYELFVKHDDHILDQAHAYQRELDVLRMSSKSGEAYQTSLKSAIAMRTSIQREMLALFGGERTAVASASNDRPSLAAIEPPSEPSIQPFEEPVRTKPSVEEEIEPASTELETRPNVSEATEAENANSEVMRYTVQVGAFAYEPNFQGFPTLEEVFQLNSKGRLTKYGSGKFMSFEAAQAHLNIIQTWAEDAFIRLIPVAAEQSKSRNKLPRTEQSVASNRNSTTQPKQQPNAKGAKQFRVRIVAYNDALNPTAVATLLRLGNEVQLKTARLSTETVYFTDIFESLESAKEALSLCIKRGFTDAEIEVLYE